MAGGIQWTGLEELILGMKGISQQSSLAIAEMTRETGEETFLRYLENLEGSSPSTDSDPLPVGMRSGDLFSKAQLEIVNQYAWTIKNESDHAAFIEFGTSKMAAREPLNDAVDILERQMDAKLDEGMRSIIE